MLFVRVVEIKFVIIEIIRIQGRVETRYVRIYGKIECVEECMSLPKEAHRLYSLLTS